MCVPCSTIAPASSRDLRLKASAHQFERLFGGGTGVQVEVAAEIGPVIERLDYGDAETFLIEDLADIMENRNERGWL